MLKIVKCKQTYHEAEGEPRVRLDDASTVVSAIETTADDATVSLNFLAKCVLAARKNDTHGEAVEAGETGLYVVW